MFEREERIRTGDVSLHVQIAGPPDGEPVVLLHGFPDFGYGWRHQVEPLARAGYRVIVPDQRGYGRSDKPAGRGAYAIERLTQDVLDLLDALGIARAHVVGHDWGGAVAWWLAANHAARMGRMVILNCPHFSVFRRAQASFEQLHRSWYIYLFLIPRLSEKLCELDDFRGLVELGLKTKSVTAAELVRYREAWQRPDAVRGMLSWYRALPRALARRFDRTRIRPPMLLLWGALDPFLSPTMAGPSAGFCDGGKLVTLEQQSHWLHWEDPARVNALICDWIGRARHA